MTVCCKGKNSNYQLSSLCMWQNDNLNVVRRQISYFLKVLKKKITFNSMAISFGNHKFVI